MCSLLRRLLRVWVSSDAGRRGERGERKLRSTRSSADSPGHSQETLQAVIADRTNFADFFAHAPAPNPAPSLIGVVCGVRVQEIEDQPMREIRYLDKLIDELAKGKALRKILRV